MIISRIIKRHFLAVILAICVGALILLPTILSIEKIGLDNFKGVYPMWNDDEDHYLTLTREVYDGHLSLSNPYIKEYKDGSYLFPPIPEIIVSFFAKLLNVSVATMSVIFDFLFPAISVLLLYALFLKITESLRASIKISVLLTGLFFLSFISTFNRPINPQFGFIFLLLGMNIIWYLLKNKLDKKNIILNNVFLATVFGILVYTYPFYWMALGVVYFTCTLSLIFLERDLKYWLNNWLYFFIPAFLFSTPFILNTLMMKKNLLFIETNLRFGFINTHIPGAFFNVGLMIMCVPIVCVVWKFFRNKKLTLFSVSLILSGIVLNWQNIITGQTLQFPQHFYQIMFLLVFIIIAISISNLSYEREDILSKKAKVVIAMIFLIICLILYKQSGEIVYAFKNIYQPVDISSLQKLSDTFLWLENNTPKDSVVYVLGDFGWAISIYTHDNVYFSSNAGLSIMSDDELENRWAIQHFFDQVSTSTVYGNRDIWTNKFIELYQSKESRRKILEFIFKINYPKSILMEDIYLDKVMKKYNNFISDGFEKALKKYQVDYLILDISSNKYNGLSDKFEYYKFLTLVVKNDNILIYRVN